MGKLEKFAEDFRIIYNGAWQAITGVDMTPEQAQALMKKMKPIIDPQLMIFAYHGQDPVGFYIMLPELNQIIKHLHGRMDLWGKLLFLYHRWRGTCQKVFGVIFGVVPEHQRKGVESLLIKHFHDIRLRPGFPYKEIEMNWVGDFNTRMMRTVKMTEGEVRKVHHTYRYLFDRQKEFKRHPMV